MSEERLINALEMIGDKLDKIVFQLEEIDKSIGFISPSIDKIGEDEE